MEEKIKTIPEDFIVNESKCLLYSRVPIVNGYIMLSMRKKGYTTFQAIDYIAQYFNLKAKEIHYCGLKDEDAVTMQLISIHFMNVYILNKLDGFNESFNNNENYIEIRHVGYSDDDLKIGDLEGNVFTLTIRNVDVNKSNDLLKKKKLRLYFPNYFDKQRFGVKDKIKNTHKIGQYILEEKYEKAINEVITAGVPEAEYAASLRDNPKAFFDSIDKRKLSFYMNSYASNLYNNDLKEIIRGTLDSVLVTDENIEFILPRKFQELINISEVYPYIRRTSYQMRDNEIVEKQDANRPLVVNTLIRFHQVFNDAYYPGKQAIRLSFFLESGCYATMAIKQLFV